MHARWRHRIFSETPYTALARAMLSAAARGLRNPQQAGGPQFMTREELVGGIRVLSDTARRQCTGARSSGAVGMKNLMMMIPRPH